MGDNKKNEIKNQELTADLDLEFSLDFDMGTGAPEKKDAPALASASEEGFSLDDEDFLSEKNEEDEEENEKTEMISRAQLTNSNLEEFNIGLAQDSHSTSDLMSSEEAKTNIETTIKDILRPKGDHSQEININDIEDSELTFEEKSSGSGFTLGNISIDDSFSLESSPAKEKPVEKKMEILANSESTSEFKLETEVEETKAPERKPIEKSSPEIKKEVNSPAASSPDFSKTEDSMRVQATIRALREEREEMLQKIKDLKEGFKELEQDNLTLKANLDEAKIEITILRKRHMIELEDIKYRLGLSEEKKALAEEKARQSEIRKEKLEQKVRIDYNQVKQREKELESKLELLSMDVDSQIQGRDQKILDLRRKIDALEFNMENTSIKEQKSHEDKRKLEEKLNKIMKTLRNSIKNLEDDIEDDDKDGNEGNIEEEGKG